jgi:hypothetical protein
MSEIGQSQETNALLSSLKEKMRKTTLWKKASYESGGWSNSEEELGGLNNSSGMRTLFLSK